MKRPIQIGIFCLFSTALFAQVPKAPSNLAVSPSSASNTTTATLNWTDNSSIETGFIVYRSDNVNTEFVPVASVAVNGTTYTDTGLNTAYTYKYAVSALTANAESEPWYQQGNASTPAACGTTYCYPEACTGLYAANQDYIKTIEANCTNCVLGISFDRYTAGNYYDRLTVYDGNSINAPVLASYFGISVGSMIPASVQGSGKKLTIRFKTNEFTNYLSTGWSITTSCITRPKAPANVTVDKIYSSMVRLRWSDNNTDEDNYNIDYSSSPIFKTFKSIKSDPNTTSVIVDLLDSATNYYFRVQAIKGKLPSSKWPVATAKTKGAPFRQVSLVGIKVVDPKLLRVGDLNSDKLPDLVVINRDDGEQVYVYLNAGNGSFTLQKIPLEIGYFQVLTFELADIDHDKDIDIIYSTYEYIQSENVGKIDVLINEGGTFLKKNLFYSPPFLYNAFPNLFINDYNYDGAEDILGFDGNQVTFFKNNRNGEYSTDSINYNVVADFNADISVKDINDDGLIDLLAGGRPYINRGESKDFLFEYDASVTIPYYYTKFTAADFDNDGDTDFATLTYSGIQVAKKENGSYTYVVSDNNEGTANSEGIISDWDNDGDPDVVYPSNNGGGILISIGDLYFKQITNFFFHNEHAGGFTRVDDWDNDGDDDVLMFSIGDNSDLKLWLNVMSEANGAPASPTTLTSTVDGGSVTLQWQKSLDDHTPLPQYNYYLGKSAGNEDNHASMSHHDNGKLKVPGMPLTTGTKLVLHNLENGTYTWGVQSIDAAGMASTFNTGEFQITGSHFIKAPTDLKLQNYSPYETDVTWTDKSANETGFVLLRKSGTVGYRVIATLPANTTSFHDSGLLPAAGYYYRVYAIAGADRSQFSPVVGNRMLNLFSENRDPDPFANANLISPADIEWMDINDDNRRDIIVSNYTGAGPFQFKIYTQSATDPWMFAELQTNIHDLLGQCTNFRWDDLDNDGDMDLIAIGGTPPGQYGLWLFRNDGSYQFTRFLIDTIADETSLDLGDYDSDGDTDMVVSTWGKTKIYFNNGNLEFGLLTNITTFSYAYSSWLDFDNDGDLDLLIDGGAYPESELAFYENDGTTFTLKKSFPTLGLGRVSIMDGDGDGDEDVLRPGILAENDRINNTFVTRTPPTPGISYYWFWADFNNDNKADLFGPGPLTPYFTSAYKNNGSLTNFTHEGYFGGAGNVTGMTFNDVDGDSDLDYVGTLPVNNGGSSSVYWLAAHNNSKVVRPKPEAPHDVSAKIVNGNTAELSWTAFDRAKNLTYNVRVGTSSGKQDILNSLSNITTGFHKTNKFGNARYAAKKLIKNLDDGVYFWSVQSIDLSYQASPFATEQVFIVGIPTLSKAHILSATAITSKRIDIVFDNVPANANTVVFVSENGQPFVTATTTSSTSHTYWGKPETAYSFKIVYINDTGAFSDVSDAVNVTTPKRAKIIADVVPDVNEDQSFTMTTGQFTVQDASGYPTGYGVKVGAGNHYTVSAGSITPETDYSGELIVKTWITTANDSSYVYFTNVNVISIMNPAITGVSVVGVTEDVSFQVTTANITAAHASGYPSGYSVEILPGDHYTVFGGIIFMEPDFHGNLSVTIKITNGSRTSDPYQATIVVSAVDDPFKSFALLSPANGATVTDVAHFDWEDAIDVDTPGPITYRLMINAPTPVGFIGLSESKFDMDIGLYERLWNAQYTWNVTAYNQGGQSVSVQQAVMFRVTPGPTDPDPTDPTDPTDPPSPHPTIAAVKSLSTHEDVAITLQLSDLTVTDAPSYPQGYKILLGAGSGFTMSGTTVTPQQNFTSNLHVPIRVANATDTSAVFIATIVIEPVNDAPSTFNLLTPASNAVVSDDIFFTWSKSVDVDGDVLSYDLILTYAGGTESFSNIGSESFHATTIEFPDLVNKDVTWKVIAKDPSGATQPSAQQFTFKVRSTATVTGLEPETNGGILFPNPATRQLTFNNINPSARTLHIFDMKGVRMYTCELMHTGELTIDVGNYPNGLYLIRVLSNDGEKTLTFEKR